MRGPVQVKTLRWAAGGAGRLGWAGRAEGPTARWDGLGLHHAGREQMATVSLLFFFFFLTASVVLAGTGSFKMLSNGLEGQRGRAPRAGGHPGEQL